MKQKKIGSDLYVFDTSAYQLTKDLDAEKIYIQQELIPAYKAVNSSTGVQAKIKPINYKLNIIQKPVWGDYIYADDPVPTAPVVLSITDLGEYLPGDTINIVSDDGMKMWYWQLKYGDNEIEIEQDDQVVSSSDSTVAELCDDSGFPLVAYKPGTATITIEWIADDVLGYEAGSASFNVVVTEAEES